jgi:formate hydrogenlyase subunit 4
MLKLLLYVSIIGCVFLPWSLAIENASVSARLAGAGLYLCKLGVAAVALGVFETSIAKMRVFRVPNFLGAALMLGLLGALLLFVSRSLK